MAKKSGITIIMTLHEIDLAQKVSDKIVCVHGETIYAYGTPLEIFEESRIRDLYNIDNGFYDPVFGSIELVRPEGEPQVFVISAGGSGIPVYRALRKENRAFIAGVLYPNDMDYELARLLAAEVITEQPFEEISQQAIEKAKTAIDRCREVIVCDLPIGTMNRRMQELIEYAGTKVRRGRDVVTGKPKD
jgi:iron complex transport system ATP-binding protein